MEKLIKHDNIALEAYEGLLYKINAEIIRHNLLIEDLKRTRKAVYETISDLKKCYEKRLNNKKNCIHMYSRQMNQVFPRQCVKCGEVENTSKQ